MGLGNTATKPQIVKPSANGSGSGNGSGLFVEANMQPKFRLIMAIEGLEKEGKTHLALSAPGPKIIHNFDVGLEGVIHKSKGKNLKRDYRVPYVPKGADVQKVADAAVKVWDDFIGAYAASHQQAKTVIVDSATELWELLRMARFGKLTQVMPHHYGPVNAEYREIIREAFDTSNNLILTHKLKDEWVNDASGKGQRTGNLKRAGFADTGFMVQIDVRCWKDADGKHFVRVKSCRQNPEIEGMDFEEPNCSFKDIAMMVFPDSNESDWE